MVSWPDVLVAALLSASNNYAGAVEAKANPVGKVLELLSNLDAKIVKEGEAAQARYAELNEFCEERSANLAFEIKTSKGEIASLEASSLVVMPYVRGGTPP